MTLRKLMLATSIVAMSATTASAIEVTESLPASTVVPALELVAPYLGTDTLTVNVLTDGQVANYPSGNNLVVSFELPTGLAFTNNVTGAALQNLPTDATALVQGVTGQAGTDTVTFLVSIESGATVTDLEFDFGVSFAGCVTGSLTTTAVTVQTEGGTDIENGGASAPSILPAVPAVGACVDAVQLTALDDGILPDVDTFIPLSGGFNSLSDNLIGYIDGNIVAGVSRSIDGTPVDATDIDTVDFTVELEDTSGISSLTVGSVTVNTPLTGTSYVFSIPNGDIATLFAAAPVAVTAATNGAVIASQQVSVSGLVVNFNQIAPNANFVVSENQVDGNLDFLQREGQEFGRFDWVGGDMAATSSVFRVTGLSTLVATDYSVNLKNAVPSSANGTYTGTIPANADGVFSLNSKKGFGKPGSGAELSGLPSFTNADVIINFETNNDLDVDRLMATTGVVTAFNDGSNTGTNVSEITPNDDADNTGLTGRDSE